jgi:hypothetical protein
VSNDLRWEVIIHFVYIGGIVAHQQPSARRPQNNEIFIGTRVWLMV